MTTTPITSYSVEYQSNPPSARIYLQAHLRVLTTIASLTFKPKGTHLPREDRTLVFGAVVPNLYFHLEDFQNILDLLRNEKTVYLRYSHGGSNNGITTVAESLGEGETNVNNTTK
jgi:hypothetical protein